MEDSKKKQSVGSVVRLFVFGKIRQGHYGTYHRSNHANVESDCGYTQGKA
jgi:hypothetical protein